MSSRGSSPRRAQDHGAADACLAQNSAQLTLTRYAKAKALLRYAKRLRQVTDATSRPRIGLNDLIMFATARAVAQHPPANSWFDWEGIKQFAHVNLGFAVDTGQALLVPVIRSADTMTLSSCPKRRACHRQGSETLGPERDGRGQLHGLKPRQPRHPLVHAGAQSPANLHPGRRSHTPELIQPR